jgi:hypothetical protein
VTLAEKPKARLKLTDRVERDGELLVEGFTVHAFVNREFKAVRPPTTSRPRCAVPSEPDSMKIAAAPLGPFETNAYLVVAENGKDCCVIDAPKDAASCSSRRSRNRA